MKRCGSCYQRQLKPRLIVSFDPILAHLCRLTCALGNQVYVHETDASRLNSPYPDPSASMYPLISCYAKLPTLPNDMPRKFAPS